MCAAIAAGWPAVSNFLFDWQNLVAGVFALIGALWTVRHIRKQIIQTTNLDEAHRRRDEAAAKAVLPLALSELVQYAFDCMNLVHKYSPGHGVAPDLPTDVQVPRIPEVVNILQTCASFADPDIVSLIWTVLQKLQVQHSRLEALFSERAGHQLHAHEGVDKLVDAADLHAAAARLFPYSRDEEKLRERASFKELQTAFVINHIMPETHDALSVRLDQIQANQLRT